MFESDKKKDGGTKRVKKILGTSESQSIATDERKVPNRVQDSQAHGHLEIAMIDDI